MGLQCGVFRSWRWQGPGLQGPESPTTGSPCTQEVCESTVGSPTSRALCYASPHVDLTAVVDGLVAPQPSLAPGRPRLP